MGTWGAGSFENDTAADWAASLEQSEGYDMVEQALVPIGQGAGLDDPYDTEVAIAAAEVVAVAMGHPGPNVPGGVRGWVSRMGPPPSSLPGEAIRAVMAVRDASELREMWEEQDAEPWLEETAGLLQRLGGGEGA